MPAYDVVILGSGLGGSMLACILAKSGVSVLMLETSVHPRFTIGESLIPETGIRLRILAEKYGVPEIGWLGSFYPLRDKVSAACGVKRSFSFVYHREGKDADPSEVLQLPTLTPPFGPDSHLFRQDTDAWLACVAVRYGARFRQQVDVRGVELRDDGVEVVLGGDERVRAAFLIDGGGMRSLVSEQLGLRDATPRFRTDTRALFSHFVGLPPTDRFVQGHGMPSPLHQGTMHHMFDGGWLWIIPFGNHRHATNPLTSVGVLFDRRKHPTPTGAPEDELRALVARFPTLAANFEGAVSVRPWVSSGRLQFSQTPQVGARHIQLPHAACFVDPLYSSGLSVLTVAVDLIVDRLLPALDDGRYDVERFRPVEEVVNRGFDHYDSIVSRSFDALVDYDLWNAWNRNWMMGNFLGTFGPLALLMRYLHTGDRAWLHKTTEPDRLGVLSSHLPEVCAAMVASSEDVAAAVSGAEPASVASARIFARLGALPFLPPHMGFGDPAQRAPATFTLPQGARHVLWYRRHADPAWRDYVDFSLIRYAREALGFIGADLGVSWQRSAAVVRDTFTAGNGEQRDA